MKRGEEMNKPVLVDPDGMEYYDMLSDESYEVQQIKGCDNVGTEESK